MNENKKKNIWKDRMIKNPQAWITVIFLVYIFILPVITLCRVNVSDAATEDVALLLAQNGTTAEKTQVTQTKTQTEAVGQTQGATQTEIPESGEEQKTGFVVLQDKLNAFTQDMFMREAFISLNSGLTKLLTGGTYMESTQVLLGKENWLFYKTESDGYPIYDYMGINRYDENELKHHAEEMTAVKDYVENELGVRFVVALIPNKEIVYEEYMPDTIARVEKESRGEQLAKYMQENTDVTFVYPREDFSRYKKDFQLYYNTDTHWNEIGAFVGTQAIFKEVYGTHASPDTVSFTLTKDNYSGDLARIAGVKKKYRIDSLYAFDPASIDKEQYRDEVAVIVGDSFSGFLTTIAKGYYKEAYRFTVDEFTPEMLKEYDADILIWESVERYMRLPHRRRFGLE